MERHFTATAFVVHEGKTLLHWHRKLQQWMPPGGHLLPGEDPLAGALREVQEETGLNTEALPLSPRHAFDYPEQIAAPYTILIEDIDEADGRHQHIDFIYFCRSLDGDALRPPSPEDALVWVSGEQLERNESLPLASCGLDIAVAEDVRVLALDALRIERELHGRP
ncbi:MAG: NUDIX domain-containing protein [Dehalococcoidia bacterium]